MLTFSLRFDARATLDAAERAGWEAGGILGPETPRPANEIRRCALSRGIPPALSNDLASALTTIGRQDYGFEVDGYRDYDPAFIIRYAVGDHFAWHVDNGHVGPPSGTRKLSAHGSSGVRTTCTVTRPCHG